MARPKNTEQEAPLEKKLWAAADKLRKNMDAAEYKHVVLGLIFLKYISDAFEELHQKLLEGKGEYEGADPEDKNEYTAEKVFYVPPSARWKWLQGRAKLPTIGRDVDDAMLAIEKDNPSLKGVLPVVFAQEKLDKQSLGGLIDMFATATIGTKEAQAKDVLGKVYEYFLGQFALAEGKKGGQFYTPDLPPEKWSKNKLGILVSWVEKEVRMGRRRHSAEQIIGKLREAEVLQGKGMPIEEILRQLGISDATYYKWRKEYGGLRVDQAKRLKELEGENSRLRKIVSDLSIDNAILKEAARGNF